MTVVWVATLDEVAPSGSGNGGVRLVDNLADAAACLERGTGEALVVIGPDVRFVEVAAFAGYVRGMGHSTVVVLVRHPHEAAVVHRARLSGITEVVLAGHPADLGCAGRQAVGGERSTPDRTPTTPTVFTARPVDPSSVARLDSTRAAAAAHGCAGFDVSTVAPEAAELLAACIRDRLNVLITGAPRAGRTTLLVQLAALAPAHDPLATLDDGRPNAVLEVMGAVRRGSLATLVAHSPREALAVLESTPAPDAGGWRTARAQLAATVDVLVHVARLHDGTRRITHIVEVRGCDAGAIATEERYRFDAAPVPLTG